MMVIQNATNKLLFIALWVCGLSRDKGSPNIFGAVRNIPNCYVDSLWMPKINEGPVKEGPTCYVWPISNIPVVANIEKKNAIMFFF